MYDVIRQIINHTFVTQTSGDQAYIYYICGGLIVILTVTFIDIIRMLFSRFIR